MTNQLREVVADALPIPALVFDSLNHSCAFGKGIAIEGRFADFYSADQVRELLRLATPSPSPGVEERALVRDLAENGLRYELTPCHDWSSKETIFAFWQAYMRSADTSIRERAAAALRTPPKTEGDMVLALEWVREVTEGTAGRMQHLPVIEGAVAAYDPERMARCGNTVSKTGQRVVDDAMVERACNAFYGWWRYPENQSERSRIRRDMRAALTAAIAAQATPND